VGVDADGVLEAALVVVDRVVELALGVVPECDWGGEVELVDAVLRDFVAMARRVRIWNGSRWRWIGCVSSVRLMSCQTSYSPSVGKKVAASSKCDATTWYRIVWSPSVRVRTGPVCASGAISSSRMVSMFGRVV
jgi:hypothetical protein